MATKAKKAEATNQELLEQFIKNNNLTFEEGKRNTDSVILSGYALHIGESDWTILSDAIDATISGKADENYHEELERVFDYADANDNNYGAWWNKPGAKTMYKF